MNDAATPNHPRWPFESLRTTCAIVHIRTDPMPIGRSVSATSMAIVLPGSMHRGARKYTPVALMFLVSNGIGNSRSHPFTAISRSGSRRNARAQFRRFPTTFTACVGTLKKCWFVGVLNGMGDSGFVVVRRSGHSGDTLGFGFATITPPQ